MAKLVCAYARFDANDRRIAGWGGVCVACLDGREGLRVEGGCVGVVWRWWGGGHGWRMLRMAQSLRFLLKLLLGEGLSVIDPFHMFEGKGNPRTSTSTRTSMKDGTAEFEHPACA